MYGRRRIGKTALLVHWLGAGKKEGVYWVAHRSTSAALLAKFSQALAPLLGTRDPAFSFSSWEAALAQIATIAKRKPITVVIDELPYLLESDPSFSTVLQASLRFHFAFVQPNLRLLEQGRIDRLMEIIRGGFASFVGHSGYEEICRRHHRIDGRSRRATLDAVDVGRMWNRHVEIDVVALDRRSRNAMVGECRWRQGAMGVEVLDGLRACAAELRKLHGFKVHYALFSRGGFTAALAKRARSERVLLVEGVPTLS